MTSLTASFGNLEMIGTSGATTMVNGKSYSLVITGSVRGREAWLLAHDVGCTEMWMLVVIVVSLRQQPAYRHCVCAGHPTNGIGWDIGGEQQSVVL